LPSATKVRAGAPGLVFTGVFSTGSFAAATAVFFFLVLYNAGLAAVGLLAALLLLIRR